MVIILAILVAVMLDRYAQFLPGGGMLTHSRSSLWLNSYLVKCINFLEKISIKQSYLVILSTLIPLCIALFIVKLIFGILLGGLGSLLFITIALFYFLGNRQVEPNASAFVVAHENSFGVFFWFAAFGPTGAFLYWFLVVGKQTPVILDGMNEPLLKALSMLHAIAAWIPARITGFIYALVGNFDPGFKCWMNCMREPKLPSSQILQDCGQAATAGDEAALVNRAFVAWVVLIILLVVVIRI